MSDEPIMAALARLEAGQEAIHNAIRDVRSDLLAELGARTAAITEKVAELSGAVTAIRDDIAVNMGAADAMQKANDNTRELVRLQGDQLSIMWKQLKQAQADIRELKGAP